MMAPPEGGVSRGQRQAGTISKRPRTRTAAPLAKGTSLGAPLGAFSKGLLILEALVEAEGPLSLSALVELTGLPKTTVHRFASVMVKRGWAQQTGQGYSLGYLLLRAAATLERSLDVRREAEPLLLDLRDRLDETVHLATLDEEFRVVYLEKLVPPSQAVGLMGSRVGFTAPAHCTGIGKAMLAYLTPAELAGFFSRVKLVRFTSTTITTVTGLRADLELTRSRGYAIDDQEHETGVACIAAPVLDRRGHPIAGISVSGPASRMAVHLDAGGASAALVCEAAGVVSTKFGHRS